LRQAATGWVAKVLLALLALSFVAWGVTGRTGGFATSQIAQVGDVPVTIQSFNRELEIQMQTVSRQLQRGISIEQANSLGIPEGVLQKLVSQAALDDQARDYNLGVPDARVVQAITEDPSFQAGGDFSREIFQRALQNQRMTEAEYVKLLKSEIIRGQLATAITGEVTPPKLLVEALYKYRTETRDVSYITIDQSTIEPIGDPEQSVLETYFEQNKERFRAPEYRKLGYVELSPDAIMDSAAVTDDDIREDYESRKARDFTTPERRQFYQVRYATKEEAEAAARSLQEGKSFDDLLAERNMTLQSADIGLKAKPEIIDPDIADAVFQAAEGAVVPVLDASLGPAIIRVGRIEAQKVTPLEDVSDKIRNTLAERAAVDRIVDLYDEIENQRGTGASLKEAAASLGLAYKVIDAVGRDGEVPKGSEKVEILGHLEVVRDAFESDVGIENNPIRVGNNRYVFYEVLGVTDARSLTLEEARDDVIAAWKREETSARVGERARELFERIKSGEDLEAVGLEIGVLVKLQDGVRRNSRIEGLSANAIAQAFAGPKGHVANAEGVTPPDRILLRVDEVTVPDFNADSEDAKAVEAQLARTLRPDLLRAYEAKLIDSRPPQVNMQVFNQITRRVPNS
ncbi:MAG TPA: SurA N-terminal domain-containing protein, partial [Afifellaceae bacterium]|nr:SurA N-terminal domain-containing protein [Afifellaceae bacterium]